MVVPGPVTAYLERYGRPIAYSYVPGDWPLASYQTVFGREPGSAEMPSAGRPFTDAMVTDLVTYRRRRRPDHAAHRRLVARAG